MAGSIRSVGGQMRNTDTLWEGTLSLYASMQFNLKAVLTDWVLGREASVNKLLIPEVMMN